MKNSKVSAKSAKESKKNSEKENANEKKVVTVEQIAETFKKFANQRGAVEKTANELGLKYIKAHWTTDGQKKPNSGLRCRLIFDGKEYDDDACSYLAFGQKKQRETTTSHAKTTDPDELEQQAAELERQAAEKRAKAAEIRKENEEFEKLANANGWSVAEAREMQKHLKKIRAKAAKANA